MKTESELGTLIRQRKDFLVVSHANPEGDAIGSSLAMYLILKGMGKEVKVFNADGFPKTFAFMPGYADVAREMPGDRFDATIVVDCGDIELAGVKILGEARLGKIVNMDHHRTNRNYGHINMVDPEAGAAGEVIFHFLESEGISFGYDVAVNLYVAIQTDTGSFRFANTKAETLRVASELVKKGVRPEKVSESLYESMPVGKLKLMSKVFGTLELMGGGRIATTYVTQEMLRETGTGKDAAEGFINFANSLEGVQVAAMFREREEGDVKVSFRSKKGVDVSRIAGDFGGGGHMNAAGCSLPGPISAAMEKVVARIMEILNSGSTRAK
jgi:phosphoesterase RecJ-like protein